jgi:hypothetical protein
MDQHTAERRFARCSQLWDAARSRRNFRTYWQDQTARRNQAKASILTAVAETLLIAATAAAGIAVFYLLANAPQVLAVIGAISGAFGAHSILTPMFETAFGPTIDRLNGLTPKGSDQS